MLDSLGTRHYLELGVISEEETYSMNHSGSEFKTLKRPMSLYFQFLVQMKVDGQTNITEYLPLAKLKTVNFKLGRLI